MMNGNKWEEVVTGKQRFCCFLMKCKTLMLRDAAATISTPVPPVPDLNVHPFDLNMLPTEEEVEEEEPMCQIYKTLVLVWVNVIYVSYARMSMQLRN